MFVCLIAELDTGLVGTIVWNNVYSSRSSCDCCTVLPSGHIIVVLSLVTSPGRYQCRQFTLELWWFAAGLE